MIVGGETKNCGSISHDRRRSAKNNLKKTIFEKFVNDILVMDLNKPHLSWQHDIFPAMLNPKRQPAVIYMKQYLVVAGGEGDDGELLSLVEVLNTESKFWSQVTSLPEPALHDH